MPVNCIWCHEVITDEDFQYPLYQEEYPDILIGPYCESCMAKIKICSGCQHAFDGSLTTYTGNGEHYCPDCASHLTLCSHCNSKVTKDNITSVGGVLYCKKCFKELFFNCPICGEVHSKEDSYHKDSLEGKTYAGIFRKYGERVCISCYEKNKRFFKKYEVLQCRYCGSIYSQTASSDPHYCDSCYKSFSKCMECGKRHPDVRRYPSTIGEVYLCPTCVTSYHRCECCGVFTKDILYVIKGRCRKYHVCKRCSTKVECSRCFTLTDSTHENHLCDRCLYYYENNKCPRCGRIMDEHNNCRVCGSIQIYSYSTKPNLYFNIEKKEKSPSILFGFENEVTFSSESVMKKALKKLYENFDPSQIIAKSDSSIAGDGFEVVTQPMSLNFFNTVFPVSQIFEVRPKKHNSCGLHVHIDRKSFISEVHLYKVINFIHNNKEYTGKVVGREANNYCGPFKKKISSVLKDVKNHRIERHVAVNLNNKHTVEFRMFAGCIDEYSLRYKIEWLHALISFTRETGIAESMKPENLLRFIESDPKRYSNILNFLREC